MKQTTKIKIKAIAVCLSIVLSLCTMLLTAYGLVYGLTKSYMFITDPVPAKAEIYLNYKHNEKKEDMREWVLNEVEKSGLNKREVDCIIKNESGWDNWKTAWNTNGSIDYGLWMINSIHKNSIKVEDRYDYKKATKWAIEKRKHDGNWSAWVAWNNKCSNLTLK